MKLKPTDDPDLIKLTPSASAAILRKRTDVPLKRAKRVVTDLLGPEAFLRGKAGSKPGARKEIAVKTTGHRSHVIGRGNTWLEALINAALTTGRLDIAEAAKALYDEFRDDPALHRAGP